MSASYGEREVTAEDRARAVWQEVADSEPVVTFTPGMERTLQARRRGRLARWLGRRRD